MKITMRFLIPILIALTVVGMYLRLKNLPAAPVDTVPATSPAPSSFPSPAVVTGSEPSSGDSGTPVHYICNAGKTITAVFTRSAVRAAEPGQSPLPPGSVNISLSDGRSFDLPQTVSADGGRYASGDESFVFWVKGNGALVLENNTEKSYTGCLVVASDSGGLPNAYSDGAAGFSIRYPADYVSHASYVYQALGPGKDIHGVQFTIPGPLAEGTNLSSSDTGISVEYLPAVPDCHAGLFLTGNTPEKTVNDQGSDFSYLASTGAAAGNMYEEQVWAATGTNPCIAVRYMIHSGNIGNYPSGTVKEFDKTSLLRQFDTIRRTLIIR